MNMISAKDMDAKKHTDTADITDTEIYEQLTLANETSMAYPEQELLEDLASPAQTQSVNSPPPVPPIHSEHSDLDSLPKLVVDYFSYGSAGVPVPGIHQGPLPYQISQEVLGTSIWAPFWSQCNWEIAHWAKMCGVTSSAIVSLLAIPQLIDKLKLLYHNTRVLNRIVDTELPAHPLFKSQDLAIAGDVRK
ncbi:hypothetical protein H4582DRAFT_2074594 [Lactarius indigo]|nr:hypothetical protein H4582DRAFT_2074594 [Lactarius indigo]